jgi:hypothetical protein
MIYKKLYVSIRSIYGFLTQRLVISRYITRFIYLKWSILFFKKYSKLAITEEITTKGFAIGPILDNESLKKIQDIYFPKGALVNPNQLGAPIVNLYHINKCSASDPVLNLAFSPKVLDIAIDFFSDKVVLESISVFYSYPTDDFRASQYWHLDYGDRKSLHCMTYLNNVNHEDYGPFVFLDKEQSNKIGRFNTIKRFTDKKINELSKSEVPNYFYGSEGAYMFVNPADCYHYGSRCKKPRFAIFITFNSLAYFRRPSSEIIKNKSLIKKNAQEIRPDLSSKFLDSLLQIK